MNTQQRNPYPSHARVHCVMCSPVGILVPVAKLILDDDRGVYITRCPRCNDLLEGQITDVARATLGAAGVQSIEQLADQARQEMRTDDDIWRALGVPA